MYLRHGLHGVGVVRILLEHGSILIDGLRVLSVIRQRTPEAELRIAVIRSERQKLTISLNRAGVVAAFEAQGRKATRGFGVFGISTGASPGSVARGADGSVLLSGDAENGRCAGSQKQCASKKR